MDRLEEIRQEFEAEKADGAKGYMIHTADVEHLLAEVDRLTVALEKANNRAEYISTVAPWDW